MCIWSCLVEIILMNLFVILVFVFVMFMDVFVVFIGKGVSLYKFCFREVICIGFIFGVIEVIILLIGWCIGLFVS